MTDSEAVTQVFLVDDHEIVRKGVAGLIDAEADMAVIGQASNAAEAMSVLRNVTPDVALLDVRLGPDESGLDVCRSITEAYPDIKCIMLTSFGDDQTHLEAAEAGAVAYVLKEIRSREIIESVRKVASGSILLDQAEIRHRTSRVMSTELGKINELTPQERRIFDLVGAGNSNRQIADEMYLAEKTVKNYLSNIFSKLGVSRRTQLTALAVRLDEREKNRFT